MRRALIALAAAMALTGCATGPDTGPDTATPGGVPIDARHVARGQDSRVLFLILHYTVGGFENSLATLTRGMVSAHYLVSDETPPRIYRLVDEHRRAWHSGASAWAGHRLLNASSIGIEIVHPGYRLDEAGQRVYMPFAEAQIQALIPLVQDIVARHGIRPERILGHGEVSPSYKEDPGPAFPWQRLAALGITPPWPDAARVAEAQARFAAALPDAAWFQFALARHGYPVQATGEFDDQTQRVLMNFQMRYRPARFDGQPDAETAALLQVLSQP